MALKQVGSENEKRRDGDQRELKPEEKRDAEKLRFEAVIKRRRERQDAWRQQEKILHAPPGSPTAVRLPKHRFSEAVKIATGKNLSAASRFMMGDNRDNSVDSCALLEVGYVPFENLLGRTALLFSTSPDRSGTTVR